jgi:hypothetical protein
MKGTLVIFKNFSTALKKCLKKTSEKYEIFKKEFAKDGVPNEIRTRVIAVKGRCPRPLDDGDLCVLNYILLVELSGFEPLTPYMPCKCSTN